jgi:hypothetical protein
MIILLGMSYDRPTFSFCVPRLGYKKKEFGHFTSLMLYVVLLGLCYGHGRQKYMRYFTGPGLITSDQSWNTSSGTSARGYNQQC